MKATEQFIKDAIEGGWNEMPAKAMEWMFNNGGFSEEKVLLDPQAWQAVGKVRGWRDELHCSGECNDFIDDMDTTIDGWKYQQKQFISELQDSKTIEEALTAISK